MIINLFQPLKSNEEVFDMLHLKMPIISLSAVYESWRGRLNILLKEHVIVAHIFNPQSYREVPLTQGIMGKRWIDTTEINF